MVETASSESAVRRRVGAAVLLVEDDAAFAALLAGELRAAFPALEVRSEGTAAGALRVLDQEAVDAIVLDRGLPDGDGLAVVQHLRARGRDVPFVLLTADSSARGAIEGLREGCRDYIVKGEGALASTRRIVAELLRAGEDEGTLVGGSAVMRRLRARIRLYSASDACALIEGETGVGKELVARALHAQGPRAAGPFVPVNCGALPEHLVESELFGHVRGAFTGALRDHSGLVELAARGTLFLDEIEDLPMPLQGKLLRLLQEGEYRPVGAARHRRAEVRVIAAGNADLRGMVEAKHFRADLYFRLDVLRIAVPALRERLEDLPALLIHLGARATRARALPPLVPPSPAQMEALRHHAWPGNVRELANFVECAAVHAAATSWPAGWAAALARLAHGRCDDGGVGDPPDAASADPGERRSLEEVLRRHRWRRENAARELGISRVTLWRRMRRLGLACCVLFAGR